LATVIQFVSNLALTKAFHTPEKKKIERPPTLWATWVKQRQLRQQSHIQFSVFSFQFPLSSFQFSVVQLLFYGNTEHLTVRHSPILSDCKVHSSVRHSGFSWRWDGKDAARARRTKDEGWGM